MAPELLELLAAVRRATDAYHRAEAELENRRAERQRAILAARREGITLTLLGEYACKAGDPPLSRRQLNRQMQAQQPWRD